MVASSYQTEVDLVFYRRLIDGDSVEMLVNVYFHRMYIHLLLILVLE